VDVEAVFPRPKALCWKKRPMPRLRHTAKPDRDNLDKCVLDALTQSGVLADDKQACAGEVVKFVAAGGEQPHVVIRVTPLPEEVE
jgi:Holliday junction resolvase RusA-like endonuclease